jgi:hypothetical protein
VIAGTSSRSLDSAQKATSFFWSSAIPRVARALCVPFTGLVNYYTLNHSQRPTDSGTDASARSVFLRPVSASRVSVKECRTVSSVLHSPR